MPATSVNCSPPKRRITACGWPPRAWTGLTIRRRPPLRRASRPRVSRRPTASEVRKSPAPVARRQWGSLSTIKLTAEEVDFLARPEIGRLAAKEPRSVKRLVNVYRIVRARMGEAAVSALLGQDGRAPSYSLLAILVAIETGQPLEVAESFYQGLRQMKPDAVVDPDSILAELRSGVDPAVAIGWQLIAAALTTAREHRGGKSISAGECLALARDV